MTSKELQSRSKLLAEKLSESACIICHDPSLALYRLHEHMNKTLPALVNRKYTMTQANANLQGACFDLDNALQTVGQMKSASPTFDHIYEMLRNCTYYKQQIDHEIARHAAREGRASAGGAFGKSRSFHGKHSSHRGRSSSKS